VKFFTFAKFGRTLLLSAVAAVLWFGCGDGANPGGGGATTGGINNCGTDGTAGSCKTVPIGGKTWMAENLNYKTEDSWCYGDNPDSCAKYGRLYTWEAAKAACQSVGMSLPTNEEWDALVTVADGEEIAGKKLKSTSGWFSNGNGADDFGFSALPGGYLYPESPVDDAEFDGTGDIGYWWTATEFDGGYAYFRSMSFNSNYVLEYHHGKSYGFSVRCVKN